jgi:Type ISP C-terminal specificity domain/N-6 DNA Methylase
MSSLETYLTSLREIRSSGEAVDETSYYGALESFLNEVGKSLKPRVRCVLQLKNRGAGMPDGGLFTEDQLKKSKGEEKSLPQTPARGVIEIKPTSDDAWITADGEQVSRYWGKYRQVLVTNYRDFVFVGQDASGKPVKLEGYRLADSEKAFWSAAAHPKKAAAQHDAMFVEFAKRTLLHAAPLTTPEDVAWFLASYARDALARIGLHELPALAAVRKALEEALGLTFEGEKGEHFFRSTLVQTLFYGVFSAWVLWSKQNQSAIKKQFEWRLTAQHLRVPVLRKLFYTLAEPGQLQDLNLEEILNWAASVLNRVDRASFFSKFQEGHAVQYFYEPFLQAFDPELRKQLGVWYTPPEIVKYMVARVDTVLREELDLPDGLADKNVYVLDPCCGTGSYLVEVLNKIHETLKERGNDALVAADLKEAAKNRVFGFELLPAPFVVSHLQLGLLLQNFGAPLAEKGNERVGVYLTNALTGWEPPKGPKKHLLFPELEEERDAAEHVKRGTPILVILGNPPYNAFAGISPEEEEGLVEPYKENLVREWKIKKFNLDDLYVRFFRLAERRIADMTGRGIVCFISNHSWISDSSFVVLRKHLLNSFDRFWIENMHGNRKISEYAPDGRTSETIFAIPGFSAGIQQGVAISLWAKNGKEYKPNERILFRDDLNDASAVARRAHLLKTLEVEPFNAHYQPATPTRTNRFSFRPALVSPEYESWPSLTQLCAVQPMNGLMEKRGGGLMDIEKAVLEKRMRDYYNLDIDWDSLKLKTPELTKNAARFDARNARNKIAQGERFNSSHLVRYALRPFDNRWSYYSSIRPLWNEPRPELWNQYEGGTQFLMARPAGVANPEGAPVFFTKALGDNDFLRGHAYYIPFQTKPPARKKKKNQTNQRLLLPQAESANLSRTANLSENAQKYTEALRLQEDKGALDPSHLIWMHAIATGYSSAYLTQNPDGIREGWPRIPLPNSKNALLASAELGSKIAALLDVESPVNTITGGEIRAELGLIGVTTHVGGGSLKESDLGLIAGWGHGGKGGVTMPGRGKLLDRDYSTAEHKAIATGAKELGLSEKEVFAHLGATTCDVYLNDSAYWSNIPIRVWEYTIGGYQVIKKWLSYREEPLLGRPLTKDEVRYVQEMARRIAAILLLEPALDANYEAVKAHTYPWPPKP